MSTTKKHKRNLIVSYKNLPEDIKAAFKANYPEGYRDYLQKIVKPNGEPIFVVPFETDDTSYMVKFEVKIDQIGEDVDKALFDDENSRDEEFAPLSEAMDKEENATSHQEKVLKHGDYEDLMAGDGSHVTIGESDTSSEMTEKDILAESDDAAFLLDGNDFDDDVDDFEPSDDDLRSIEVNLLTDARNEQQDSKETTKSNTSKRKTNAKKK
ncbi:MAG: hypothetical protein IJ761_04880 [Bacteroidales bacterium]|nr:hypothetical protein [Bacteroidales bacterium]